MSYSIGGRRIRMTEYGKDDEGISSEFGSRLVDQPLGGRESPDLRMNDDGVMKVVRLESWASSNTGCRP